MRATRRKPEPEGRIAKQRLTVHVPVDLVDEAKNAIVALSGPPHRLTLAAFAEAAIRRELARLRKANNAGKAFAKRSGELRGGRPLK